MFGIAFDLDYAAVQAVHPKGVPQAYKDIERTLEAHGCRRVQQSLSVRDDNDFRDLFAAVEASKALPWLPQALADLRAFRLENWSDMTASIKGGRP